jgi:hypothetical protein
VPGVWVLSHRHDHAAEVGTVGWKVSSVKYDYPGGVFPEERPIIEVFERDVVPYVEKNGGRIGEMAMRGDLDAEEVIRRYNQFINGMPHLRRFNLKLCFSALKRFEGKAH